MSGETAYPSDHVDRHIAMLEEAWRIRDTAIDYIRNVGREVQLPELMDKVFVPSGALDQEKAQLSGDPPKIFFKTPYGLRYRPEFKDWIPFRHGPLPD